MSYATFEYYKSLYADDITEEQFNNFEWDARRTIDANTTGIDNVRKLRVAFPVNEENAEAVKRCVCKLVKLMYDIAEAEKSRGIVHRSDGSVVSGPVASVSSGSESISYAANGGTALDAAVSDIGERNRLYIQTVRNMLSGVTDANGVCLLYMGVYPYVL